MTNEALLKQNKKLYALVRSVFVDLTAGNAALAERKLREYLKTQMESDYREFKEKE